MKTKTRVIGSISLLALVLLAAISWADAGGSVPDSRLVGQWQGKDRFGGMSYNEIVQKKVTAQDVDTVLNISADGRVTGRIGGGELTNCTVMANRGWLGRHLHLKTDFIIRGNIVGAVVPGSEGGTHVITAPFNLRDSQLTGTVFAIHNWTYPYPVLGLRVK
jgi:hypothetical protein